MKDIAGEHIYHAESFTLTKVGLACCIGDRWWEDRNMTD